MAPCDQKCTSEPHMPVLLIAIVTSPGCSDVFAWTSSRLGSAGAIQRSCDGFVQTPMLGFVGEMAVMAEGVLGSRGVIAGEVSASVMFGDMLGSEVVRGEDDSTSAVANSLVAMVEDILTDCALSIRGATVGRL